MATYPVADRPVCPHTLKHPRFGLSELCHTLRNTAAAASVEADGGDKCASVGGVTDPPDSGLTTVE
jgi:hypothetical protein